MYGSGVVVSLGSYNDTSFLNMPAPSVYIDVGGFMLNVIRFLTLGARRCDFLKYVFHPFGALRIDDALVYLIKAPKKYKVLVFGVW